MKTILITGAAGFIGSNLADSLLDRGYNVIAVDNFDDFYDIKIKRRNIAKSLTHHNYRFIKTDIANTAYLKKILPSDIFAIMHLAAKAGVRSSIISPDGYERYNTDSITKSLELAVKMNINKFIFSSSSSIYGNSAEVPFNESQNCLKPLNPYAISKLQSEQIGKVFSERKNINFISLRLFSVYGPRLRPDLLMSKIVQSLFLGTPLKIYGNGSVKRDFTHVKDIINGIINSLNYQAERFDIFNLGYGHPVSLLDIIGIFETITGEKIKLEFQKNIKEESDITWADNSKAKKYLNFFPEISLQDGIKDYLKWYSDMHKL